jgi:hypothetical protein
MKSNAQL